MGRRFSLPRVAACLVAGLALWFTRASLDVIGGPVGEVRVAMFPSGAELLGLTTLAFVVIFLLRRLTYRLLQRRPAGNAFPTDALLPLFALAVLAAPYLPWLPDVFPTIRVFAGPGRYALWALVVGHVIWLAWHETRQPKEPSTHDTGGWSHLIVVFAISALALGAAATVRTRGPLHPGGDEPHYLVVAQSVLRDGDLRIDDNHRRGDYREYYAGELKPDFIAQGRDGSIYSIHPIGLPLLIAPAYALAGYAGVTAFLTLLAAVTAALAWRAAVRQTGSPASATLGWLAVTGAAPWVLHSFSIYPEATAAAVLLLAMTWVPGEPRPRPWTLLAQGCLIGSLPWLSTKYAPMSAVVVLVLAARRRTIREAAAVLIPYGISLASWLAFFFALWGSPLPTAPYGDAHQTSVGNVVVGVPALLFDQEYGLLPYAPALLLAAPGLWHLFKDGGPARRLAIEIVLTAVSLALTVGAYAMWWGGSSAPARQIVAALPLLAVPIARWDHATKRLPAVNAAGRSLVLVTLTISAALVMVREGLLTANRRDGSSQLLEWLAPSADLVRAVPSFIAHRDVLLTPLLTAAMWVATAIALGYLLARVRRASHGAAAALAVLAMIGATIVTATAVPLAMRNRLRPRLAPSARPESAMLWSFDSRARPVAVVYDNWQRIPPDDVPALFRFEGRPGMRRDPQPVRVLLNTRLALPAGLYDVELKPTGNTPIDGNIALQLGRKGRPVSEWPVSSAAGASWSHEFRLDMDTSFVGFRSNPALERVVGEMIVRPRAVVNAADRLDRRLALPPVLAAAQYADTVVYFHDDDTFPETAGFWVRGASDAVATFVRPPGVEPRPVRVRVHPGAARNHVEFSTGAWRSVLDLAPGEAAEIEIPILRTVKQAAVRIVTTRGFVPAETTGGRDRRFLGCWVEVIK